MGSGGNDNGRVMVTVPIIGCVRSGDIGVVMVEAALLVVAIMVAVIWAMM